MLTAEPIHTFPTENYQRATHTKIENIKRKEEEKRNGKKYIYFCFAVCREGQASAQETCRSF